VFRACAADVSVEMISMCQGETHAKGRPRIFIQKQEEVRQ